MIYFNEIYYRAFFFLLSASICSIVLYFSRQDLYFVFSLPTLSGVFTVEYFIFTSPQEIFLFTLKIGFFFLFFFLGPYMTWSLFDYMRPGFSATEHKTLKKHCIVSIIIFIVFNGFVFFYFCPLFWNFFFDFSFTNQYSILNFFPELRPSSYFGFIFDLMLIMDLILPTIFFFCFIKREFLAFYFAKKQRYFIVIFLIISTLFTPPLLKLQVALFILLYMCFEIFIFLFFFFEIYRGSQLNATRITETKIR